MAAEQEYGDVYCALCHAPVLSEHRRPRAMFIDDPPMGNEPPLEEIILERDWLNHGLILYENEAIHAGLRRLTVDGDYMPRGHFLCEQECYHEPCATEILLHETCYEILMREKGSSEGLFQGLKNTADKSLDLLSQYKWGNDFTFYRWYHNMFDRWMLSDPREKEGRENLLHLQCVARSRISL